MDPVGAVVKAIAVRGGLILALGSLSVVKDSVVGGLGEVSYVDLDASAVVPGFVEVSPNSHSRLSLSSSRPNSLPP